MKNFDLDSELKSARVPERNGVFWDAFPRRVLAELRAAPAAPPARARTMSRLAWSLGAALACLAAGFCLGQSRMPRTVCCALRENGKELRRTVRQFPVHVRILMQDEHGLHKLIEDPS
jgi:hypothetical protein